MRGWRLLPVALAGGTRQVRRLLRAGPGASALAAGWWSFRVRLRYRIAPPVAFHQRIPLRMASDRVGVEVLPWAHAPLEDPGAVIVDRLPRRCAIRATHASGATLLIDDRAPLDIIPPRRGRLAPWGPPTRLHPDRIDPAWLHRLARLWHTSNYWRANGVTEWAYRDVPPRLIVEELLDDGAGVVPPDLKFWCFDGTPAFVQVDLDRLGMHRQSLVRPDWTPLDARFVNRWTAGTASGDVPHRPSQLEELLRIAARFAQVRTS